jgi:hypothetical protein
MRTRRTNASGVRKGRTQRVVRVSVPVAVQPLARARGGVPRAGASRGRPIAQRLPRRVSLADLSKRTPPTKAVKAEARLIRRKQVLPKYSRISHYSCEKKRAERRRDYFSFLATGRRSKPQSLRNRLTVRCN